VRSYNCCHTFDPLNFNPWVNSCPISCMPIFDCMTGDCVLECSFCRLSLTSDFILPFVALLCVASVLPNTILFSAPSFDD